MNTIKAQVAIVKIGHLEIEGLMMPDGTYAVAIPQVADLFQISRNTASRDFKRLVGEGFSFLKVKSPFNNKEVNAISLDQFNVLLTYYERGGNFNAQKIRDELTFEDKSIKWLLSKNRQKKVSKNRQKKVSKNRQKKENKQFKEKIIQSRLAAMLNGQIEVAVPVGKIDLLTENEIIEIKETKGWKSAIGQVIAYGQYYPDHKKVIYLFNKTSSQDENVILQTCQPLGVFVVWQDQDFYETLNKSIKESENKVEVNMPKKPTVKKQKKEDKNTIQLSLF